MHDQKKIIINDVTLRDGNHAVSHQLNGEQIKIYCQAINQTGVDIVEVGHGNGLGASSLQLGLSPLGDIEALCIAKEYLTSTKLAIHVIPGFATVNKDLKPALQAGVDVVRVASHCSEADLTARHIQFVRDQGKTVFGVLMMSHMLSTENLIAQALKMESYGAEGLIIMDSAGYYLPSDVTERITALKNSLSIDIGFHAHNNLGLAIANSVTAFEAGAVILDASAKGFGAGAGNAQLEVLVAVLQRMGYLNALNLYSILDAAELAETNLIKENPKISSLSIISGLSGVFSGFLKPVKRIADQFKVDPRDIFIELGKRKIIAGQEDLILEVATNLANKRGK